MFRSFPSIPFRPVDTAEMFPMIETTTVMTWVVFNVTSDNVVTIPETWFVSCETTAVEPPSPLTLLRTPPPTPLTTPFSVRDSVPVIPSKRPLETPDIEPTSPLTTSVMFVNRRPLIIDETVSVTPPRVFCKSTGLIIPDISFVELVVT